jgi:Fe2+ transport system protein FeoA
MVVRHLSELEPPEAGRIVQVGGRAEIRRRLMDMGVVAGAVVEVQRLAPLGDPVEIRVKGYDLAIRKEEASKIQVEMVRGSLARLAAGEKGTIVAVKVGWGMQRRLADLGLTPGTEIKVVNTGRPGPAVLEVRGSRLALGQGVAEKIIVRPEGVQTDD